MSPTTSMSSTPGSSGTSRSVAPILERPKGVDASGNGSQALCSAQEAKHPSLSATVADLAAAIQVQESLANAPWSLTIVDHAHDAEFLREQLGEVAVAVDEPNWKDSLHGHRQVLLIGYCQRIAGDLRLLGVQECYAGFVPVPYRYASEFLEDRAKASHYSIGTSDLRELWRIVADSARSIDSPPTGHPELQQQARTLPVFSLADLGNMPPRRFIVDGLCYDDALVGFVGPPKSFKTVLSDALCVAVADGSAWLDRKVLTPGLVIDLALEGMAGKLSRYQAHIGAERFTDPDDPVHRRLFLMSTVPDITTVSGQDLLLRTIEKLCTQTGEALRMLKLDTLARGMSLAGLDENATVEMGLFIAGLDRIRAKFPAMQFVVHHTEKSGKAERGSTALRGACDLMMFCEKQGNTETKVSVRDARDVEVPPPWTVSFAPVVVGEHENGRPITGMRINSVQVEAVAAAPGTPKKLGSDMAVENALRSAGVEGCTRAQVVKATSLGESTAWDALNRLVQSGIAVMRKGKPCRYWHKSHDPGSGDDPGKIRPDLGPDQASGTMPADDPVDPTAPLEGAGPDLRPDRACPDEALNCKDAEVPHAEPLAASVPPGSREAVVDVVNASPATGVAPATCSDTAANDSTESAWSSALNCHEERGRVVRDLAERLMARHGLVGWTFHFDRAKTRYGLCRHKEMRIQLSKGYVIAESNLADITDTILHEIAHALVPADEGHGKVWRAKAIEIGCSGERCGDGAMPAYKRKKLRYYKGVCPSCRRVTWSTRRARVACGGCTDVFDEKFAFVWSQRSYRKPHWRRNHD